jgi:arsenite oxidase small subunit
MHRRRVLAAGDPAAIAANGAPRFYSRCQLVREGGRPLKATELVAHRNYVFHYPYQGTPCVLLNLGGPAGDAMDLRTEQGDTYRWQGGIGPGRAVVAFSAICAHQLTYPTRELSFIAYREGASTKKPGKQRVIHCCSDHSQYDPALGAKVLGGPAKQPLAAILLEHDTSSDALFAVGTLGGEMFDAFFRKYEFRLTMEFGSGKAQAAVGERATVIELDTYSRQRMQC